MATTKYDCLFHDSLKISLILSKWESFLWIVLFIVNIVIQKDLKDPIWLTTSITIFIFMLTHTGMQIYALRTKNFYLLLSCSLLALLFILLNNLVLMYYISSLLGYHIGNRISKSIDESMRKNQIA